MTISLQELHAEAERRGMPGRTLEQVQADIAAHKARSKGKNAGLDVTMARMMLNYGRLTEEARDWLVQEYVYIKY